MKRPQKEEAEDAQREWITHAVAARQVGTHKRCTREKAHKDAEHK